MASELQEQHVQFIAARNGLPPWSTEAFVIIVREIDHHSVVSAGNFADEFHDKCPWEWMNQALKTFEDAT